MKIALDISQIVHGTGVSFYTADLVRSLAKLDRQNDYLLFGYSLRQKEALLQFGREVAALNRRFSFRFWPLPPSLVEKMVSFLPGRCRPSFPLENFLGPFDLYHSSDWLQFPCRVKKVTIVHDLGFWRYPELAHPRILKTMTRRLHLVQKEVDRVIAVSQTTAADLTEFLAFDPEKITVIPEAPPTDLPVPSAGKIKEVTRRLGVPGAYFLAVANLDPRKNLKTTVNAFLRLRAENSSLSLVIVGHSGWDDFLRQGIPAGAGIFLAGYVSRPDLAALYAGAQGLLYPSLYEGFGLPILEAMGLDCPVLTSNLGAMKETAGRAAILVDPADGQAVYQGLKKLLTEREKLISLGHHRFADFSWAKTARKVLEVYETLCP